MIELISYFESLQTSLGKSKRMVFGFASIMRLLSLMFTPTVIMT